MWASGKPIPTAEQELMTACMAAHVNRFGVDMTISVRGYYEDGTRIPVTDEEADAYKVGEGCFFGNLFKHDGAFSLERTGD